MSSERKQSLFIVAYPGQDIADEVYETLRSLQKEKKIDIKTAATIIRKPNGKLKLKHKRRLTVGKGALAGSIIAVVLTGGAAGAIYGGAALGAIAGSTRSNQRQEVKEYLDDKLGQDQSALAILIGDADWEAVREAVAPFGGENLRVRLTPEARAELQALASDEKVATAVADEIEAEDDVAVEEVDETDALAA